MDLTTTSIGSALKSATRQLAPAHDSAHIDAEALLCHTLQQPRSFLYTWPHHALSACQYRQFRHLITRRAAGEPLAYLTGRREFWSLPLQVTPATLIPRPETELLVEQALSLLTQREPCRIIDLGTGSGAIALAIAHERPDCQVTALDISERALAIAKKNAAQHGLGNIRFIRGDWLRALVEESHELIVANPPYVRANDPHLQLGDLPYEPATALIGGIDGLQDIRKIAAQALPHLTPGGWLLLEHGYDQRQAVSDILQRQGFCDIQGFSDLAGNDRGIRARKL